MNSVMLLVLKTIADDLPADGSAPPTFTVNQVIARVWDRNWRTLTSAGFSPDDLRAIAVGAWSYAEKAGWRNLRSLFPQPASEGPQISLRGIDVARAGVIDLPSGRWAWIAPEHDGFAHVSLQLLERSTERMEGAVREADFSGAEVDRIARDPSIRWWWDRDNEVIWEIRKVLRVLPSAGRELTFSHVDLGSRSVNLVDDLRLGELTDGALESLLRRSSEPAGDSVSRGDRFSASA